MEQNNTVGKLTQQSDDSDISPPPKRPKNVIDQELETTSSNAALLDDHLIGAEHPHNQQSTNSDNSTEQLPLKNGIFNFILPSEEDCALNPEENLEPNSAGLKSSRTRGVWHKSLEGESLCQS